MAHLLPTRRLARLLPLAHLHQGRLVARGQKGGLHLPLGLLQGQVLAAPAGVLSCMPRRLHPRRPLPRRLLVRLLLQGPLRQRCGRQLAAGSAAAASGGSAAVVGGGVCAAWRDGASLAAGIVIRSCTVGRGPRAGT